MPGSIVITSGTYSTLLNRETGPTRCHVSGVCENTGPIAKPRAGSVNAAAAITPVACAVPLMNRRRVTVSPSKAPGSWRSCVYLEAGGRRRGWVMLGSLQERVGITLHNTTRRSFSPAVMEALCEARRRCSAGSLYLRSHDRTHQRNGDSLLARRAGA